MNKFAAWLDKNPGLAKELADRLGINPSTPSNVRHERRPMPTAWFPVVCSMSEGAITYEYLTRMRNRVIKKLAASKAQGARP